MKNEIKKALKKYCPDLFNANEITENDISTATYELESAEIIDFSVQVRTNNDNGEIWLQAEAYHPVIKREVIIDYNFPPNFPNVASFIDALVET